MDSSENIGPTKRKQSWIPQILRAGSVSTSSMAGLDRNKSSADFILRQDRAETEQLIFDETDKVIDGSARKKTNEEFKQARIRDELIKRYRRYYAHWRDFDILLTILAITGLLLQIINYENSYSYPPDSSDLTEEEWFKFAIQLILTVLAFFSLLFRMWLRIYWMDYKKPTEFYQILMINSEQLIQNAHLEKPRLETKIDAGFGDHFNQWMQLVFSKRFMFEFSLLFIFPWPRDSWIITNTTINWSGDRTEYVDIYYSINTFLFAFMFLRIFFIIQCLCHMSQYSSLYARRICQENGLKNHVTFILRVNLAKHPLRTIIFAVTISLFVLAYLLRLFERPYYSAVSTSDTQQLDMEQYSAALWLTFITMTTVGYGDLYACTPMGRIITFIIAVCGAILLSILFATMSKFADLTEQETLATGSISDHKNAAICLGESMEYFTIKRMLYEQINTPEEDWAGDDPKITKEQMQKRLKKLQKSLKKFNSEAKQNKELKEQFSSQQVDEIAQVKSEISIVKNQVLDLNDKFDLLIHSLAKTSAVSMSKDGSMNVDLKRGIDLSLDETLPNFNTMRDLASGSIESGQDQSALYQSNQNQSSRNFADIVQQYQNLARKSNFGGRQILRQEIQLSPGSMRKNTARKIVETMKLNTAKMNNSYII